MGFCVPDILTVEKGFFTFCMVNGNDERAPRGTIQTYTAVLVGDLFYPYLHFPTNFFLYVSPFPRVK